MRKLKILVIYYCEAFPLRATNWYHLYCFDKYSCHDCLYLNIAVRNIPNSFLRLDFDLIIFDTLFMCMRWSRDGFLRYLEKVKPLARHGAVKIALPQDEFISTDILCQAIEELDITRVFTVAPESELKKIYSGIDFGHIKFYRVLPGYLDDEVIEWLSRKMKNGRRRKYDIGYRTAGKPYPWFGRHGYLKQIIAEAFEKRAPLHGLKTSIATSNKKKLVGKSWYRFLLDCRFTIGTEGGTSILDRNGSIHEKTIEYLKADPDADFESVERACFPGMEGNINLFAISPRHLEACATRTCQVLTTGQYNGVLVSGKHYIEVDKDLANIDSAMRMMGDEAVREEIVTRAYRDIVESGKYSYRHFVQFVLSRSLQ